MPVSALSAPLARQLGCVGAWGAQQRPLRWPSWRRRSANRMRCARQRLTPEYVGRVASFFRQIGARGLLMHGTEGEAYANPLRCPQIHYIAGGEQRVLLERTLQDETPTLPAAKNAKPPRAGPSAARRARWRSRRPSSGRSPVAGGRRRERDAGTGAAAPASGLSATILGYFLIG